MIRRPPRSTLDRSSAASDVYKRQTDFYDVFRKAYPNSLGTVVPTAVGNYAFNFTYALDHAVWVDSMVYTAAFVQNDATKEVLNLSLIHISEPTRPY